MADFTDILQDYLMGTVKAQWNNPDKYCCVKSIYQNLKNNETTRKHNSKPFAYHSHFTRSHIIAVHMICMRSFQVAMNCWSLFGWYIYVNIVWVTHFASCQKYYL